MLQIQRNLIKAIKEGKISKVVGRGIIRKLRKKGLPVDPQLLEVVNGSKVALSIFSATF